MLRQFIIFSIAVVTIVPYSHSQTSTLAGIARDSVTLEPLIGANISLVGTLQGVATSPEGTFAIRKVPPGPYLLRVSFIGYAVYEIPISLGANDSLFVELLLRPEHIEEEEVVVTATRTARNIADVPVRIEAVPQEEVEEKLLMTPSNVAMLLNESTGMRVQTTSAASNTANLRIQGLNGRYTQILIDGIPNFGGLSAGFGLTQIPPLNLRQVEVIKGATSALYGADAISGVVNFITKDPKPVAELSAIVNGTTQRGVDAAGFYAQQFDNLGLTLLASRNTQSLYDVDGDGFGDVAEFERYTLTPKILLSPSENLKLRATLGILYEDRLGGALNAPTLVSGTGSPYREEIESRRIDLASQLDWTISGNEAMIVKLAGMKLQRDAFYGRSPFNATQEIFYADAQYSFPANSQNILLGTAFTFDEFTDRTPVVSSTRSYRYTVPAVFAQDEILLSRYWTVLVSGRVDFHNRLGNVFTPRASLMYRPASMLTMRIGGGTGFKSPTIFVEEAEEVGFRNVRPLQNIQAEKATSGSFDLNWRGIFGQVGASFNLAFYVSSLSNALLADQDSLENDVVYLRSATGTTLTRGGEFSAKLTYDDFKLSLGYTYLYASQSDNGTTYELELNPRHSFGAVFVWESQETATKVGIENYWTGSQRLERNPFRDHSPEYWITGMIAEKGFGHFRFFVNFENIFDTRQTRYEPIVVGNLQTGTIRTLPVYAPLEGRVINGGFRFVL